MLNDFMQHLNKINNPQTIAGSGFCCKLQSSQKQFTMTNLHTSIEVWKPINGYEGYYEVSNRGNVKSLARKRSITNRWGFTFDIDVPEKIILASSVRYKRVALCKEGKCNYFSVHRLVATAFIDNSFSQPYINHKDGNKLNNNVENLEWVTAKENSEHAYLNGLIDFEKLGKHRIGVSAGNSKMVLCLRTGIYYDSSMALERARGMKHNTLRSSLNGRRKNNKDAIYI